MKNLTLMTTVKMWLKVRIYLFLHESQRWKFIIKFLNLNIIIVLDSLYYDIQVAFQRSKPVVNLKWQLLKCNNKKLQYIHVCIEFKDENMILFYILLFSYQLNQVIYPLIPNVNFTNLDVIKVPNCLYPLHMECHLMWHLNVQNQLERWGKKSNHACTKLVYIERFLVAVETTSNSFYFSFCFSLYSGHHHGPGKAETHIHRQRF